MTNIIDILIWFCPEVIVKTNSTSTSKHIHFLKKVAFSSICLLIFLTLSAVPIYGAYEINSRDPFHMQRLILSTNR